MKKISWLIAAALCVGTALSACSAAGILNATIPSAGYSITKDVPYGRLERQKLDIYIPDNLQKPAPVVVFFYGGSWRTGSKDDYLFVGQALASKGYVAVIADYRLYPDVAYPTFVEDGALAVKFTHETIAKSGGNPRDLFVMGHSAGAYNALMVALNTHYLAQVGGKSEWIKGAIGISGPYNFLPITDPDIIPIFPGVNVPSTQPIHYVRSDAPPTLLLVGDDDEQVKLSNSTSLDAALKAKGVSSELHVYPGVGHISAIVSLARGFRGKAPILDDIAHFIDAHKS